MRRIAMTCCFAALGIISGCEGKEVIPEDDGTMGSACGTPVYGLELDFSGVVLDADGMPAAGASVTLEDRSVRPAADLGTATTGSDGTFFMEATDITSWPDCWLTVLDYQMVASLDDAYGELMVNRQMWEAIQAAEDTVDLSDRPVELSLP